MASKFAILALGSVLTTHALYGGTPSVRAFLSQPNVSTPPPITKFVPAGQYKIPGEYLIVFRDDLPSAEIESAAAQLAVTYGVNFVKVWSDTVKGAFVRMTEQQAMSLMNNVLVKFVEENAQWFFSGASQQTNINPATCDPTASTCPTVVDDRLWQLDRGDQNYAPPTNQYSYCTDGTGVTVYVVDNGVNKFHNEFGPSGARVLPGFNASGDQMPADDPCIGFAVPPSGTYDYLENLVYGAELLTASHGTAVAAALGGRRVGVAKNVTIVPVKTARCDKYSARARRSAFFYQQNQTMFRSPSGSQIDEIYRARNGGFTAGTEPTVWNTGARQLTVDGQITWELVPISEWTNIQSTQMIIDGLLWILSPSNPGPKSYAIVTMSTFRLATSPSVAGPTGTLEAAIRSLLASNITVVASANNQNGNACDTSPARLSINNPNGAVADNVITAGGSMIINRPWSVDITDVGGTEADGGGRGLEPSYDVTKAIRDGRWICGKGDASPCSNTTSQGTISPADGLYGSFLAGSNGGSCVTLFAPAKNLFVPSFAAANAYRDARVNGQLASGTSWSAPMVAGYAARIMQTNPTSTPVQIRTILLANSVAELDTATLNTYDYTGTVITGTPNKLLQLSDVNITSHPASTAAASIGPTHLSVTATGTSTVAFLWYEVNAAFDYATYKHGASPCLGTPPCGNAVAIGGATGSSFDAPASTTRKAYFVRASKGCGSADSDIAVVVPRPASPTNVSAVATGVSVSISWTPGLGAETYRIERKVAGQSWTTAGQTSTVSFAETPTAPEGMVLYRVVSLAGAAYLAPGNLAASAPSSSDLANVHGYTDDPLTGDTEITAQHVIELRSLVNALCHAVDAPNQYQANELIVTALQDASIVATHFTDLMTRINNIRTNSLVGLAPAAFVETPVADLEIKQQHLQNLRDALR